MSARVPVLGPLATVLVLGGFALTASSCSGDTDTPTSGPGAPEIKTIKSEKAADPAGSSNAKSSAPVTREEAAEKQLISRIAEAMAEAKDEIERDEVLNRAATYGRAAKALAPKLRDWIKDKSPLVRASTMETLATIDPENSRDVLETGLKDGESEVREKAALGWAKAGIKDLGPLLACLRTEIDAKVQHNIMATVEKLGDASHVKAVGENLTGLNPTAAKPAIRFLTAMKAVDQANRIIELLRWDDEELRVLCAEALSKLAIKTKPALQALVLALRDDVIQVRRAAFQSLKSLTGQNFEFDPAAEKGQEEEIATWKEWVEKQP